MTIALLGIDLAKPFRTYFEEWISEGFSNAAKFMNGRSVWKIGWGLLFKTCLTDGVARVV